MITACIHFFQELDNNVARPDFLMNEAESGTDPDALLGLIGTDQAYWDRCLDITGSAGKRP